MYDEELIDYNSMESSWDIEFRNYMLNKFNLTKKQWYRFWDIELVAEGSNEPNLIEYGRKELDKIGISMELEEDILKERNRYVKENSHPLYGCCSTEGPVVVVPF